MKNFFLSVVLLTLATVATSQLTVDTSQPPVDVITNTFLANGIFVSNVTFTGVESQLGVFEGSNCNVGIDEGIIMATGMAEGAIGPNNSGSSGTSENFGASDADLALISGFTLNDAAVIEFDFIATGDSLDFQFVFGSEEYPEFVNSAFNDIFGFFISGPGISGPYANNAMNIALIPGTDVAVAIDNVNDGEFSEYYVANGNGFEEPFNSDPYYIQCDGFTTVLHASQGQMQVGEVYHIKLAIADASDGVLDSFVFLSGNSFVQFCNETEGILPDLCMLSHLDATVTYTGECGQVEINNFSDINVEYTNCYIETGDGEMLDACESGILYNYSEPGTYTLKMVYEVGEFQAQFVIGDVIISSVPPVTPEIVQMGDVLTASNFNTDWLVQWYFNGEIIPGATSDTYTMTESGNYSVAYTNSCGTISSTEEIIFQGLNEWISPQAWIYPNPSNGSVQVNSIALGARFDVFDLSGKLVFTARCDGGTLSFHTIPPGVYSASIVSQEGDMLHREIVVIQ